MKRILAAIILACMCFAMFGCGSTKPEATETTETTAPLTEEQLLQNFARRKAEGCAKSALSGCKGQNFKNPASVQIHGMSLKAYEIDRHPGEYTIKVIVDYSAQNGFGGMNRDTYADTTTVKQGDYEGTSSIKEQVAAIMGLPDFVVNGVYVRVIG